MEIRTKKRKNTIGVMSFVLVSLLTASMLVGCVQNKDEAKDAVLTATDVAIEAIAESKLTEDEMFGVVKEYYSVFNSIFEATGDNIVAEVEKSSDGTVSVNTARPEMDEENIPTGKTITDKAVFSWGSVKEAFAYLYEQKQIDIDGKLLFSEEDVTAQIAQSDEKSVSNSTDTDSKVSSEGKVATDTDSMLTNPDITGVEQ